MITPFTEGAFRSPGLSPVICLSVLRREVQGSGYSHLARYSSFAFLDRVDISLSDGLRSLCVCWRGRVVSFASDTSHRQAWSNGSLEPVCGVSARVERYYPQVQGNLRSIYSAGLGTAQFLEESSTDLGQGLHWSSWEGQGPSACFYL